jgi:uncharacterized protein YoxC
MASDVTREEFEARVGVLEREVEGEKMVTRHILVETRRNTDDLAAIKGRLDRVEVKLDGLSQKVGGLEHKVGSLEHKVDGLIRDLPMIVSEAVREALPKRRGARKQPKA